jgi:uncharacterized protein DUF2497
MSKLDPTSESLESILASIRRSLAEQSTDILADDGAAPAPVDPLGAVVPAEDAPPRFLGNGGSEAPYHAEPPLPAGVPLPAGIPVPTDRAFAGLDDPPPPASISAALARRYEASASPAPAPASASPQPEESPKDPLWFLARGKDKKDGIPAPTPGAFAQPAPASMASPAVAEPKPVPKEPALKEIVRGPLPPFFGSSPEAAKVEVSPAPPTPGALLPPAAGIPPPAAAVRPSEADPPRTALPGAPAASAGSAVPPGAALRETLPNGKANSFPVHPAADSTLPPTATTPPGASTPQLQSLDAMVADLLRPMLRRWLDENMPRLVSAALKAEAETLSRRDPKKP